MSTATVAAAAARRWLKGWGTWLSTRVSRTAAAVRRLVGGNSRPARWIRGVVASAEPWLGPEAKLGQAGRGAASWVRRHPWPSGVLAAALLWMLWGGLGGGAAAGTVEVRKGRFEVKLVEPGTLQALRSVSYASRILSNQAKIVAMAPEGKLVAKGDLLILFDAAPFQEEIRRNQALLAQARADLDKAKQDLNLQKIQNQEELATARQKVARSEMELRDVQEGKGKLKEEEAIAAVAQAERERQKAASNLEDLRPLLAEGFITKLELERAEQQLQKAEEDLALAQRRRDALLNFGRPLEVSQAESDASMTRESMRQLGSAVEFRLRQKQAAIDAAQSRIEEAQSKLQEAREQLSRTEVRADVPGIVVYSQVFFGSERRKPQVGDQVWANQPLLILPDISTMIVETQIRETDIHKVVENQKVAVKVAAYPDLALTGKVTLVGTLAQEQHDRRGTKFFGVTIQVGESDPRLRPGMTARVEILVEQHDDALYVPIEAVFEREGRNVCYLARHGGLEAREVLLGPSNQDFVMIREGLRVGDRVSLRDPNAPPSAFGEQNGS
jgi:HlyD family secretion protein